MDKENYFKGLYRSELEHDSCGVGFVAGIRGEKSSDIIGKGLEVLERMQHRGAEGADNKTGDGSGIMIQMPHAFFKEVIQGLPEQGNYAAGMVFFPEETSVSELCASEMESIVEEEGLSVLGWRDVPVDNSDIGDIARRSEPVIRQIFIINKGFDEPAFERKLYIIRKIIESRIRLLGISNSENFHIPSFSSRTIVYKGMLTPPQVRKFYPDLSHRMMKSAIALVHSRFSTNTFPSWNLAQPFRYLAFYWVNNTI